MSQILIVATAISVYLSPPSGRKLDSERSTQSPRERSTLVIDHSGDQTGKGVISIALAPPPATSLSNIEAGIIAEMNRARSNPAGYERVLLGWRSQFVGNRVRLYGRAFLQTQEGVRAVDEAILFLRRTRPVPTLQFSRGLTLAARDLVRDQGSRGTTGHYGSDGSTPFQRIERYGRWQQAAGENITYGPTSAQDVVRDLIIDDGVRDRGHRTNMFQPRFRLTGVACGYHRQYRVMCDIKYVGGFRDRYR